MALRTKDWNDSLTCKRMKKLLAMGAVLAALTSSVQAQFKESAVTSIDGRNQILTREGASFRWTVTGGPTDVIWIGVPYTFGGQVYNRRMEALGLVKTGILTGARQLFVERIEYLANNQIRVTLRYDPSLVTVMPGGWIRRSYQGELIGGNVLLCDNNSYIIDSDQVLSVDRLY